MKINWKTAIRDTIIIWLLTGLGGFMVGLGAGAAHIPVPFEAIAIANLIFGTIGFTIIGCLATHNRFTHLIVVAAISWLTSIINVVFLHTPISMWFSGLIGVAMMLAVGGGFSFLIRKPLPQPIDSANPRPRKDSDS